MHKIKFKLNSSQASRYFKNKRNLRRGKMVSNKVILIRKIVLEFSKRTKLVRRDSKVTCDLSYGI